jgi:O-antigen ligase
LVPRVSKDLERKKVNAVDGERDVSFLARVKAPTDGGVAFARALMLGFIAALLVSTSASIAFEFAIYITFAVSPELRRRFVRTFHHPMMVGLLAFAATIVIATFHGPTSWHNALGALAGWRRLLLVPLAMVVFDDASSKRLLFKIFMLTCLVGIFFSFETAWRDIPIVHKMPPGIVFHNYSVQGLSFSLAAIVGIAAILRPEAFAGDRLLGSRAIMAVVAAVLIFDVAFVLWGRSGYLALIVMAVVIVTLLARGSLPAKALAGFGVLVCVVLLLGSSAQVRSRVEQAVSEFETADQSAKPTSLGYRAVFWPTTLRMVRDHPLFGVGTGGFEDGYRPYGQSVAGWQGSETADPHNQFLKILGEQGLIGLAAFLFFIFRALTCQAPTPYRQLATAALISWCATSLANSHFSTFVEGRLIFFWLGAMLATPSNGTEGMGRV